jgi:hypothetical protein
MTLLFAIALLANAGRHPEHPFPREAAFHGQETRQEPPRLGQERSSRTSSPTYAERELQSRDLEEFAGGGAGLLVLVIVVVAVLVLVAIILPW